MKFQHEFCVTLFANDEIALGYFAVCLGRKASQG